MKKERIEYGSPVDALVAVAKHLSVYENQYGMASEDFYTRYKKGRWRIPWILSIGPMITSTMWLFGLN